MDEKRNIDLSKYRFQIAEETLSVAEECFSNKHYRDAINRSYYAAFYAAKAILATEGIDFKRHKDVVAYFNQNYVATGKFSKDIGRKLARLQQKREKSDYDDFFLASVDEAKKQFDNASDFVKSVRNYLDNIIHEGR